MNNCSCTCVYINGDVFCIRYTKRIFIDDVCNYMGKSVTQYYSEEINLT